MLVIPGPPYGDGVIDVRRGFVKTSSPLNGTTEYFTFHVKELLKVIPLRLLQTQRYALEGVGER